FKKILAAIDPGHVGLLIPYGDNARAKSREVAHVMSTMTRKPSAGKSIPPPAKAEYLNSVIFTGMVPPPATPSPAEGKDQEQQGKLRRPAPLLKKIDTAV